MFSRTLLAAALSALAFRGTAHADDLALCERTITRLPQVRNLNVLAQCQELYFQNPDQESPPGSFNKLILLGYRYLEIDPRAVPQYGNTVWALWSKWTNWSRDPVTMPDGEHKLDEALALLRRGQLVNATDAVYHFEAGNSVFTIAYSYSPELAPLAIEYYDLADRLLITISPMKIRTRLQIAHIHNWRGDKAGARAGYLRVLEIDPSNSVAKRALERLEQP